MKSAPIRVFALALSLALAAEAIQNGMLALSTSRKA
jgi:hypothetical protein